MAKEKDYIYDRINEFEDRINKHKASAETTKEARMRAELKVEQLKKSEDALIKKITDKGLDPMKLKGFIMEQQDKLVEVLNRLDDIMPDENGKIKTMPLQGDVISAVDRISDPIPDNTVVPDYGLTKPEEDMEAPKPTEELEEILPATETTDGDDPFAFFEGK